MQQAGSNKVFHCLYLKYLRVINEYVKTQYDADTGVQDIIKQIKELYTNSAENKLSYENRKKKQELNKILKQKTKAIKQEVPILYKQQLIEQFGEVTVKHMFDIYILELNIKDESDTKNSLQLFVKQHIQKFINDENIKIKKDNKVLFQKII